LLIDSVKTSDRLLQGKLWKIMGRKGYPEHLTKVTVAFVKASLSH